MTDRWEWKVVLYGSVFCNGFGATEDAARRAAVEYADNNLTENTRMDAHFEVSVRDVRTAVSTSHE